MTDESKQTLLSVFFQNNEEEIPTKKFRDILENEFNKPFSDDMDFKNFMAKSNKGKVL